MQPLRLIVLVLFLIQILPVRADEKPADGARRPKIEKLGTIAVMKMENSPVVFNGKLYRVEWDRATDNFYFTEHDTGKTTTPFAKGWAFANAYVEGETMYVTGAQHGPEIRIFYSKDLEHWASRPALQLQGWTLFNTSICKAGDRYIMMFEVGSPEIEAGVPFTARFAESKDLEHWTVLGREYTYDRARYTAPHALRFLEGYFYNFFLEHVQGYKSPAGGYEMNVVRSKDLIHWELSPLNPVLKASDEDRKILNSKLPPDALKKIPTDEDTNNSDLDFCEYQGKLVMHYAWGNQRDVCYLGEAVFNGSQAEFLKGWFPEIPAKK